MAKLPIWAIGNAGGDDGLMLRYAQSLYDNTWILPSYNDATLSKGFSYPLFLVLCNKLSVPYLVALALFYVLACVIFIISVYPVMKNKAVLSLLYLYLLYSPVGFNVNVIQRVYRQSVIFPTVVIIFSCFLAIWLRKNGSTKKLIPWSVLCGCMLSYFWFIREDSVWIMPFFSVCILIYMVHAFMFHRKGLLKKTLVFSIMPAMLLGSVLAVSVANHHFYGTYYINDRIQGAFAEFCASLMKIESGREENDPRVWIYRDALDQFAETDPEFKELEEKMYTYDSSLRDGEFLGDLYHWSLRMAANSMGYYKDPKTAEKYFTRLNNSLTEAFDSGKLKKNKKIFLSSQAKGFYMQEIPSYIKLSCKNLISLMKYDHAGVEVDKRSSGSIEQIRSMEAITCANAVYPDRYNYKIKGSIKPKNTDIEPILTLYSNSIEKEVGLIPLEKDENGDYTFDFEQKDIKKDESFCVNIHIGDTHFSVTDDRLENDMFEYKAENSISTLTDETPKYAKNAGAVSNFINDIYAFTAVPIIILSFVFFVIMLIGTVKQMKQGIYELWNIMFYMIGLMLTIAIVVFANSIFNEFLIFLDGSNYRFIFYTVSVVPLFQILEFFSVYFGIKYLKQNLKNKQ